MRVFLFLAIFGGGLSGCAAIQHNLEQSEMKRQKYCHYDGAFNLGMSDGTDGRAMNTDIATVHCDGAAKQEAIKGYREGYVAGINSRKK